MERKRKKGWDMQRDISAHELQKDIIVHGVVEAEHPAVSVEISPAQHDQSA